MTPESHFSSAQENGSDLVTRDGVGPRAGVFRLPHGPPDSVDQLPRLHAVVVLSMLMNESSDEGHILHLAATAAPSLAHCRLEGTFSHESGWHDTSELLSSPATQGALEDQLNSTGLGVRELTLNGRMWTGAFPVRARTGVLAYFILSGRGEPSAEERFILTSLTQQCGVALMNARLRATAAATNEALERSVETLQRSMVVHETLTRVAASSERLEDIARALRELTGFSVCIEDRYGNLRVWEGPGQPHPYPKDPPERRERLLRELAGKGHPIRDRGRLSALASPRPDVVAVLSLVQVPEVVDDVVFVALEHGTTVLAMKLAQLRAVAEVELRVRRDLGEELLAGTDELGALSRANALEYDLERPHWVVLFDGHTRSRHPDAFLHIIRRCVEELNIGSVVLTKGGAVAVLAYGQPNWEDLRQIILSQLGGGWCKVAVGGEAATWRDIPRSYREALLAISLQRSMHAGPVTIFDDLGFYRFLSSVEDFGQLERFMRDRLRKLLDNDASRSSELVKTLARFLDCGGNYDVTTKSLCIGRTTLRYRLQRIRDISGCDLNDPETRLNLHVATRAWQTLNALRAVNNTTDLSRPGQPDVP
jgi:DNA-binding PucR family transcriptional regulator